MSRNGRRQGFIVACAPIKKIAMTAKLNSPFGESSSVKFVAMFTVKGKKKVTRRSKDVIVKTYPYYSSPTNPHYRLFCKYQLLKYKP